MKYDIIRSGPGGYVSAIRASQLGFKVAVIEKKLRWCLLRGAYQRIINQLRFYYLKHASDYGLTVSSFDKDFLQ
jgi:dihydrolipoamide dehydrogenase